MSPCLFLAAALLPGQTVAPVEPAAVLTQPVAEPPSPLSSTPPPSINEPDTHESVPKPDEGSDSSGGAGSERWFLMKVIQDTALGEGLERRRIEVTGWTALGYLTSTT